MSLAYYDRSERCNTELRNALREAIANDATLKLSSLAALAMVKYGFSIGSIKRRLDVFIKENPGLSKFVDFEA
jgi:hypothetical protein